VIRFIATKHARYAEEEFENGDIIIDPFRYIPDREGVRVERLGENRPEIISLLVPTRGRPTEFRRMVDSALGLATYARSVEVVAYHDEDDVSGYYGFDDVIWIKGPQILLSETWNECYRKARGNILMHCGDDLVFRTPGWDQVVRDTFAESKDKLILVHGDDMSPNTDALATHGFLHRRWVDVIGYFVPPYFSSDWNDVWLTEVADKIGRRVKVPIVTEHMHYAFGKAEHDVTYRQREERGARDNVGKIYERTKAQREADAARLQAFMT